jgi:hypothetical protein
MDVGVSGTGGEQPREHELRAGERGAVSENDHPRPRGIVCCAPGRSAEDVEGGVRGPVPGELLGVGPAGCSVRSRTTTKLDEPRRDRVRRARVDDESGIERLEDLREAPDVRRDHRCAAGEGLDHDETETLQGGRGDHREVCRPIALHEVVVGHGAEKPDRVRQAG